MKDDALDKLDADQAFEKLCYAYGVNVEEHLALSVLDACCVSSKQIKFLPEDCCQLLSFYSTLCFSSHNNWKHLCTVKYPIQLRSAPIIKVEPQQKNSPVHQEVTLKVCTVREQPIAACPNYFT